MFKITTRIYLQILKILGIKPKSVRGMKKKIMILRTCIKWLFLYLEQESIGFARIINYVV